MSRSHLYIERNLQEVLLTGPIEELEAVKKASVEILKVNKTAIISKEHFKSLQQAWKKLNSRSVHSAVGRVVLIPNLEFKTGEKSFQLFIDLTRFLIIQEGRPAAVLEAAA